MRKDDKFIGVDGTVPEGQGIVMAHLNECHELVEMVMILPTMCLFCLILNLFSSLRNLWMMKTTMTTTTNMMMTTKQTLKWQTMTTSTF